MERCLYPAWLFQFFATLTLVLEYFPHFEHWLRVQTVIFPSNLIWRKHHTSIWSVSAGKWQIGVVQSKSTKNLILKSWLICLTRSGKTCCKILARISNFYCQVLFVNERIMTSSPVSFLRKRFLYIESEPKIFRTCCVLFWSINKSLWKSFCQTALKNTVGNPLRIRSQFCVLRTELLKV